MSKRWLGLLLLGVWISGGGVAHAIAFTATPNLLDIGPVVVTQSKSADETLSSDTQVSVNVALDTTGDCLQFQIAPTTVTVGPNPPDDDKKVTVTFTPVSTGDKTCTVTVKRATNPMMGMTLATFTVNGKGVAPQITVVAPSPQSLAFNHVDVGQTSTAQAVTIRNDGSAPLTIASAKFTGGGTDYTKTDDPTDSLATGQTATWNIACKPSAPRERDDTFEIRSDSLTNSTIDIPLTCIGDQGTLSLSAPGIDFGTVPRGTMQTRMFTLTNTGNVDVKTINLAIDPANAGYTIDTPTLTTLAANGGSKAITVTFKPMVKTDGSATINVSGIWGTSSTLTSQSLTLTGTEASFGLDPVQPMIDFGKFRYDTHPKKTFQLLNDGKAPLMMTAPFVPDSATKAGEYQVVFASGNVPVGSTATLAEDAHVTVEVTAQVQHRIGVVSGRIDITPDVGAPLHVPVTGIATAGEVDAPATVDFGVVDLSGPPVTQTIMITNNGDGALDIRSVTATDPSSGGPPSAAFSFALPSTLPQLERGASLAIPVTYQPTVATGDTPDAVLLTAQLGGSLDADLTIMVTGGAVLFQAHGSGGCDAGGRGRDGGLAIALAALVAVVVLRRRRRLAAGVPIAAALALAPAARADGIGLSVFAPTPSTAGEGFALQAPEIGAGGSWVASAVVSYASNPLVLDSLSGGGVRSSSALVERSTLMQLGLAYSLYGRLELGAHLPLYQQSGEGGAAGTPAMAIKPVKSTATGNLAFHVKARLLRAAGTPGALALGASAIGTVPTATRDQFTGADQPEGRLLVLAAFTPAALDARLTISVNVGPVIRKESHSANINVVQKSAAAGGGGLSVRILDELWATAELFGEATPSAKREQPAPGAMPVYTTSWVIEGLAGLTIKPDHRVSIGMAVGRGVTGAIGTPDLRGMLSVSIVPGAAPLAPIHPVVPDGDADGDGIPDSVDQCPHQPEDKDGFQDQDGCPDPDNDRDGILDAQDRCPLDPEDKDGFEDADGCPDPDNDHDGIPDKLDKCPLDPEDKDGFEDLDGCPDPDNDHDGIPDEKDRCPSEPETINGFQDDDGCPDKGDSTIILSPDKIETLDPIQFTGVKLARGATPLIEQVGATLRAHPEILRVRITVHVQPTSDPDADQARTDKRAQAVRDWLVQWGVAPARLEVRGFGGDKPLVPPDQRGAAKLNERIEFIILERN